MLARKHARKFNVFRLLYLIYARTWILQAICHEKSRDKNLR